MEETELVNLIEHEISQSVGFWDGELAAERKQELDYYYSRPYGNEVAGESQVVSTEVFDTVEGMLPSLLKIFTASDDAVRFEPTGPEDEEQAEQQTAVCNYVFYKQNNGFLILYEWFKDALMQKNGIVTYWWEDKKTKSKETYQDLTEGQWLMLQQEPGLEVLEHEQHDDPVAAAQKQAAIQQVQQQAQGAAPATAQMIDEIEGMPVPKLHNVTVECSYDKAKLCIQAVPPEEFGVSNKQTCISLQDAPFCYHRTRKPISYLREMGYPEVKIAEIGSDETDSTDPETLARDHFLDQRRQQDTEADESQREVWVTTAFIRVDYDGDGIAELRKVIKASHTVMENEETDHINFAAITPIIMPHRWAGRSAAELAMSDQFLNSTLWRQMLNNLYLSNNPRKAVLSSAGGVVQANLDDLMTYTPGAIMREYVPNAIRNEEVPFVAGAAFPMLEYIDAKREIRTGQTRYSQGTDADTLNKTARGIAMIQQAGQQRLELIARVFAETGVKDLFQGIVYMLSKYSSKSIAVKLRNKWVDVDPREWKKQYNMTINVGLGTGNKDLQLAQLAKIAELQGQFMELGRGYMVQDEHLYNLGKKISETMGYKHPELFFADPRTVQKPPPQVPPEMMKMQADAQESQAKIASSEKQKGAELQHADTVAKIQSETTLAIAQLNAEKDILIEKMREQHEAQMEQFRCNNDRALKETDQAMQMHKSEQEMEHKGKELAFQREAKVLETPALAEMAIVPSMMEAMQNMVQTFGGINESLNAQTPIMRETLTAQNNILKELRKPKTVSLGKLQKDANGQIVGATVNTKLQ